MAFSPTQPRAIRHIALLSKLLIAFLIGTTLSAVNADDLKSNGMIAINDGHQQELSYAIVSNQHSINFSGNSDDLKNLKRLKKQQPLPFVWFKQNGQEYLLTDAATVATIQSYWVTLRPHEEKIERIEQKMKPYEQSLEQLGQELQELNDEQQFNNPVMRSIEQQMQAESEQIQHLSVGIEDIAEQIEQLSEQAQTQTQALIKLSIEQQRAKKL